MEKKNGNVRNRWVFVIAGVIALLMVGQIYAWSVMSQPIAATHPDWTAAQLSLTFTLAMVFFCVGNLTSGICARWLRPRLVVFLGGVLFLVGFFAISMTGDGLWTLYLGFGILGGLGAGLAYNSIVSAVTAWFPDKHGLVSGIMLMGFGLSAFLFGNLYTAVTPSDGGETWCVTFRVLGIVIFAVLLVTCFFFRKPDPDWEAPAPKKQPKQKDTATVQLNSGRMLRTGAFWLFYLWIVLAGGAGMVLLSQASGMATEIAPTASAGTIAFVVGMISILNGIGRVIYGALYDRAGYRFTMSLDIISFVVTELLLILALRMGSFPLVVFAFMLGGFAFGALSPMASAFTGDFFGHTHYALNFSIVMTNGMFASVFSTIAGRLYDVTLSYQSTFYMMLALSLVGLVLFLFIRRPKAPEV